jgi:hypothetical protein
MNHLKQHLAKAEMTTDGQAGTRHSYIHEFVPALWMNHSWSRALAAVPPEDLNSTFVFVEL